MFKTVRVKNFQSLRDVEVELAPFTVIVGASDSGKSAFFRAMSTLISNRRGSDFITHGEKLCSISADMEQGRLTLQRGNATKDNFYKIEDGSGESLFSKLSGTVPEEVSTFLGIEAKDPINLASQFDKPYLLDTKEYSSAESARILGALTNVNILFEAARESNRRKTEASSKVRTREADIEDTQSRLTEFTGLEAELAKLEEAESHAVTASKFAEMRDRVRYLLTDNQENQAKLETVRPHLDVEIPDLSEIERLVAARASVLGYVEGITQSRANLETAQMKIKASELEITSIEEQREAALVKEGKCPTCGTQMKTT